MFLLIRVIYSNECVFQVNVKVKKHNVRISRTENSHETREVARNEEKAV